jgi:predicted TIM-barrel fold metal-dependent hydrolase
MEEVLVKHPRLRVNLMHAGYPLLDDLLALYMPTRRCTSIAGGLDRRTHADSPLAGTAISACYQ